ncbi:hypothetical protein ACF05T_26580 [Streptomyces lateritius]|uniref:Uncharacterized protein n=1 Tax=Streptomyces lateritius TaxID=67313 RepID=A0ABW6YJ61_9ACTN
MQINLDERTLLVNITPLLPGGGDRPHLIVLLFVAVAGVVAAQSEAWASALGTASAVYTVMSTSNQDGRN